MTPRLQSVLNAVRDLTVDGVSPSYQEIAEHIGVSSKGRVCRMVDDLVDRGMIVRTPGKQRCLRLTTADAEAVPFDRMADAVCALARKGKLYPSAVRRCLAESFAGANS